MRLPDPLLGRTIAGRYVLQEKVGVGGMGSVYRAADATRSRDVALKFLAPELCVDETNRQRFLREAKAANRIDHEHIIDITDYGQTDDGLVYLVMEYLDGHPLNEVIAEGPFSIRRALMITLQMTEALARAHELGVVHRDIKPENIFLLRGYDGDYVKLLDFGLAKMKGELRLTATGTVFGTPEYMAPEQARGAPTSPSVDLYAVGCVLYEMLTNRLPFEGSTPDLILQHMRAPPPSASASNSSVPQNVDNLVRRLMAKTSDERPPTAYALAAEIRDLLEQHGGGRKVRRTSQFDETTSLDVPFSEEEAWASRVDQFQRLVARAHPDRDGPPWLYEQVDLLQQDVNQMRLLRVELQELSERVGLRETAVREARLRFGRALDELGDDESRVLKGLQSLAPQLKEASETLERLERPLLTAWASVAPMPSEGLRLSSEVVDALVDAGKLAKSFREAAVTIGELGRHQIELERERDDLRFQISQLKGRLGSINADAELEIEALRTKIGEVDTDIRRLSEEMVRRTDPVYKHLMSMPATRSDVLRAPEPTEAEAGGRARLKR